MCKKLHAHTNWFRIYRRFLFFTTQAHFDNVRKFLLIPYQLFYFFFLAISTFVFVWMELLCSLEIYVKSIVEGIWPWSVESYVICSIFSNKYIMSTRKNFVILEIFIFRHLVNVSSSWDNCVTLGFGNCLILG